MENKFSINFNSKKELNKFFDYAETGVYHVKAFVMKELEENKHPTMIEFYERWIKEIEKDLEEIENMKGE